MSQLAIDARQKKNYARLQSLAKINRDKLDKADQLNFDLFQREIKTRIGEYQFKPWMFAIRPFDGPQLLAETAEFAPFKTVKDYDNWIARINATGVYIDQWIVLLTPGHGREAHAAARHHQQGARADQGPDHRRRRGQPVLRAVQEDAGQHSGRREGAPHRRGQDRRAERRHPGVSSASTSSSARSIYPRRATPWASTTSRAATSTTATASRSTPPSTTRMRRASTTSASKR